MGGKITVFILPTVLQLFNHKEKQWKHPHAQAHFPYWLTLYYLFMESNILEGKMQDNITKQKQKLYLDLRIKISLTLEPKPWGT